MATSDTASPSFGDAVRRVEDPRLVTGQGRYVDNLPAEGALRAVFVRTPVAHARVTGIDVGQAVAQPGVAAAWTAADLDLPDVPAPGGADALGRPVLARDVVRFAGEPVAIVVASSLAIAEDAAEQVLVDYDPLPPIIDPESALDAEAPLLFPGHGSNLAAERAHEHDDVLADADVVVTGRFVNQRLAPAPLETNSALAVPGADDRLTVWTSTQAPFRVRDGLARALGLHKDAVRVVAPDVGGGFGAKLITYPEYIALAAAALRLGRPVRWTDARSESMAAMTHGRAHIQRVEVGATREGVITGLRIRLLTDVGAYPTPAGLNMPSTTYLMACGTYRIPKVDFRSRTVFTNTTPVAAYRGAGRPEATALVERAVDLVAAELGLDPVTVRRRNLVSADAFPYTTPTGAVYDSGDYEGALDAALQAVGYEELRKDQAERRAIRSHMLLGVGVATYVEVTAPKAIASELGEIAVSTDGSVTVRTGVTPNGQGHETALAQLVAGVLRVPLSAVHVAHSDTTEVARGMGTMGSRSLQIGGSAVYQAAEAVVAKARMLAAHLREAAPEDVVPFDGGMGVRGSPETRLSWAELALAAQDPTRLPAGMEPGLHTAKVFDQSAPTFPAGAHAAVVEVDADTGRVRLLRHVAADDCGRVLNPMLADGQVHGGLAQGIAQALYEEMTYDEHGNPLAANLMSYLVPGAPDLPGFELIRPQSPTPLNPLGVKGIGEAAAIGSTPAVQNAVVDALSHLGVRHIDLPATPDRVWRAIQEARG